MFLVRVRSALGTIKRGSESWYSGRDNLTDMVTLVGGDRRERTKGLGHHV